MVIGMSGAKQLELSTCPEQTMLLSFILVSEQIRFNYLDEIHILKYHKSETNKKSDYKILLFIWTFWRYFTVSCCLQVKGILLCHQILAAFRLTCYFKSNISYWFASILSLTFYIFSQKMEENRKGTQGKNRSESNSNVVLKNYIVRNQQEIHQRPKTFSSKTVSK